MSSFWTTYKYALQLSHGKDANFNGCPTQGIACLKELQNNLSANNEAIKGKNEELYNALCEFARLTHTVGNFTILMNPDSKKYKNGFNGGRAVPTCDYWELSLGLMKKELCDDDLFNAYLEAFDIEQHDGLMELFHVNERPDKRDWAWAPKSIGELKASVIGTNERIKRRGAILVKKLGKGMLFGGLESYWLIDWIKDECLDSELLFDSNAAIEAGKVKYLTDKKSPMDHEEIAQKNLMGIYIGNVVELINERNKRFKVHPRKL